MMSQNGVIAPTEEGLACFLNDQCLLLFLWHHLPSSCDHPPAQRFNPSQSGRWLRVLMTEFDQGKVHKNADREFLGFFFQWKLKIKLPFEQHRSALTSHRIKSKLRLFIYSPPESILRWIKLMIVAHVYHVQSMTHKNMITGEVSYFGGWFIFQSCNVGTASC